MLEKSNYEIKICLKLRQKLRLIIIFKLLFVGYFFIVYGVLTVMYVLKYNKMTYRFNMSKRKNAKYISISNGC
jgi:hypothetical protein